MDEESGDFQQMGVRTQRGCGGDGTGDDGDPHSRGATIAYLLCVLLGCGVLAPWNMLITVTDYLAAPCGAPTQSEMETYISASNMSGSMLAMAAFAYYRSRGRLPGSERAQMAAGFASMLLCMLVFAVAPARPATGVSVLLALASGVGNAVSQGSLYGFVASLPARHMVGLMIGNGVAGVLFCVLRVVTDVTYPCDEGGGGGGDAATIAANLRRSAELYFGIGVAMLALCVCAIFYLERMPFTRACRAKLAAAALPEGEMRAVELARLGGRDPAARHAAHTRQPDTPGSEPAGSGGGGGGGDQDDHHHQGKAAAPAISSSAVVLRDDDGLDDELMVARVMNRGGTDSSGRDGGSGRGGGGGGGGGLLGASPALLGCGACVARRLPPVHQLVWHPGLTVFLTFVVTIGVFPALTVHVGVDVAARMFADDPGAAARCVPYSWQPLVLITVFNVGDVLGKSVPNLCPGWRSSSVRMLRRVAVARVLYVPVFFALVATNGGDAAQKFGSASLRGFGVVLVFTMAVTGGYVSSAVMAAAPPLVGSSPARRAAAGSFMTLALIAGLTGGALLGVVLDAAANGMRAPDAAEAAAAVDPAAACTA